jgi:hypothetical protein
MHEIDLLDETFVKNQSYHYHLSIQTGLNGLSFSILDLQTLKYIGLRNYGFENIHDESEVAAYFSVFYKKDELLKLDYKSVSHAFVGDNATIVPSEYFEEKMIQNYYGLNFSEVEHKVVQFNPFHASHIFTVFAYPENLFGMLKGYFPKSKLFHYSTVFLDSIFRESIGSNQIKCYLYFYKDFISIALAEQKQLKYFNTFKTQSITDILYYMVSVFDQYKISTKLTEMLVSTDIENHNEVFENLNKFFGNIRFIAPSSQFTYSYLFDELHLTQYANLFNLALCE